MIILTVAENFLKWHLNLFMRTLKTKSASTAESAKKENGISTKGSISKSIHLIHDI